MFCEVWAQRTCDINTLRYEKSLVVPIYSIEHFINKKIDRFCLMTSCSIEQMEATGKVYLPWQTPHEMVFLSVL